MVELVVRLVFSLAVVVGMLLLLARFSAKRFRGTSGSLVRVVHRQPLSRTSAVAVVTVGSRVLVLGTTEQQVQLLTELEPEEAGLDLPLEPPSERTLEPSFERSLELAGGQPGLELVPASDYAPRHAARPADPGRAAASTAAALRAGTAARAAEGALAGSLLSAQTWKQAFAVATSKGRDAS